MRIAWLDLTLIPIMAALAGCSSSAVTSLATEEAASSTEQASTSSTFFYFRCNATGWGVDDATRMIPTAKPGVYEISFEVKEPWMVSTHDDCVITETPERNRWGHWQHYWAAYSQLNVPSATHYQGTDANLTNFSVRYPSTGRYRATVSTSLKSVAVVREGDRVPGDVVWALGGSLMSDSSGHYYSTYYGSDSSVVARVNMDTGTPEWALTFGLQSSPSLDPACAFNDSLLIGADKKLSLYNASNGTARWTTDLRGELAWPNVYFYPRCAPTSDLIYVVYGDQSQHVAAVRRATGDVRWSVDTFNYGYVTSITNRGALVQGYDGNNALLRMLDAATGRTLWSLPSQSGVYPNVRDNEIYLAGNGSLQRIRETDGTVAWSRATDSSSWISFENNALYLHESSKIHRLAPATGEVQVTFDLGANTYPSVTIASDGAALVTTNDYTANSTQLRLFSPTTGAQVWSRQFPSAGVWPLLDKQGNFYVAALGSLSRIEKSTGASIWSTTVDTAATSFAYGYIVDSGPNGVYATWYRAGGKYPPMSLVALDPRTGAIRWRHDEPLPISFVGSDARHIFISTFFSNATLSLLK